MAGITIRDDGRLANTAATCEVLSFNEIDDMDEYLRVLIWQTRDISMEQVIEARHSCAHAVFVYKEELALRADVDPSHGLTLLIPDSLLAYYSLVPLLV